MPTHFTFSFGVGDLFDFSFKYGTDPDDTRDDDPPKTPDAKEAPHSIFERRETPPRISPTKSPGDSDLAKKWGVRLDPDNTIKPVGQSGCPLFTTLPAEIRYLIWRQLLTTTEPIERPHKHIGSKETAMLTNYKPIPDVDAVILRTCRAVYQEALPILYGQNAFQFSTARAIQAFQTKGLVDFPLDGWRAKAFNFRVAPVGRLTMIRSIVLDLHSEFPGYFRLNPHLPQRQPDRDNIWRDWSTTFFNENTDNPYTFCAWGGNKEETSFPALEKCTLNFTEWQLTEEEGLLVKPFIKKLGESGGLQQLVLKGVKHPETIEKFRTGLVKEGGIFRVENQ